ncbi:MAG: hypothetical protein JWO15_3586 [Sphingomonadales bacterium]|nr:hypothetical protein [Sphingomonadales bacterium]
MGDEKDNFMMAMTVSVLSVIAFVMMLVIPQVLVGLVYATLIEYLAHWLVLHKLGVKKGSFFSHHWHGHHRAARLNCFMDGSYLKGFLAWNKHGREFVSVFLLILVNTLLFWNLAPVFVISSNVYALAYLYLHRKMHLDAEWGRVKFPWHYDHHMGNNQNANWGVLTCVWDVLFNTRIQYKYSHGKATKK